MSRKGIHQASSRSITDTLDRSVHEGEIQRLRCIMESLPVGVITIDRNWRITSFNRAAEEITGYEQHDVMGWPCFQLFQTPMCQRDCPMERALSCAAAVYDREVTFTNRSHRRVTVLVNATPLYDEQGKVIGGVETLRDISAIEWMRQELAVSYDYSHIVGNSKSMLEVYKRLNVVAKTDTTVLISGESGTGKELVARAVHYNSDRRDRPFVGVNCSALPEGVLESELFGHVRGAFTGAIRDKAGRFEFANGGTLFLDEVGELTPSVQVKLLRVLEEQEFQRVGEVRSIRVNVRMIAATNKHLRREVKEGRFRDDLYYRLNVFPIELPPLRERTEDIPLLVLHFIEKFNHQMGRRVRGLSGEAMDALFMYGWPGNVRELENAVEHAFVRNQGVLMHLDDLPRHILRESSAGAVQAEGTRGEAMGSFERQLILQHLEEAHWRRRVVARRLGISPVTLWRKMKKYDIQPFQG